MRRTLAWTKKRQDLKLQQLGSRCICIFTLCGRVILWTGRGRNLPNSSSRKVEKYGDHRRWRHIGLMCQSCSFSSFSSLGGWNGSFWACTQVLRLKKSSAGWMDWEVRLWKVGGWQDKAFVLQLSPEPRKREVSLAGPRRHVSIELWTSSSRMEVTKPQWVSWCDWKASNQCR